MSLFAELKRRNVFRVGIAYLITAWLVLQVADVMIDNIGAPAWLFRAILLVLAIGFVIALIFAWAFEMTPEGLKRDAEIDHAKSAARQTGRKLDRAIIVVLVLSLAYFVWEARFAGDKEAVTSPESTTARVEPEAQAQSAPAEKTATAGKSVAVLPFMNMSSDAEQEYFSDGITEEVINALVKVPGLSVPARTSVFAYKGRLQDVREIGRELNVAHVLEGSIRSQGRQVRITAQLIEVESGYHLWSETFDRQLENIFAVQEEIAGAIAEVLVGELGVAVAAVPNQTRDMKAYDLYLQGRAALRQRDQAAIELFGEVTRLDPDFAPGWAALAMAHNSIGDDNEAAAIQAAEKALSMDPDNVDALNAIGASMRELSRWSEAERYLDQALAIDPSSAELLEDYAEFLNFVGRTAEALDVTTRAMAIEPGLLPLQQEHVAALLAEGRPDEARNVAESMAQGASYSGWYRQMMGWMLQQIIDTDQAPATAQPIAFEVDESEQPPVVIEFAKLLEADDLMTPEWGQRLKHFFEANKATEFKRYFYWMSRVALVKTGYSDFVFDMDQEIQRISFEWTWVPAMAAFRENDRFADFLETTGMTAYWDATSWPKWCQRGDDGVITCR